MANKRVTIGRVVYEGKSDKELFQRYLVLTVTSMARLDCVTLPYEFVGKLENWLDTIPDDEFEQLLDDADPGI